MSNDKLLYVIVRDIDEDDADNRDFWKDLQIFTNLKEALNELDNIYKQNQESKYYNYHIKVYNKINNTYIISHQTYHHQKPYS